MTYEFDDAVAVRSLGDGRYDSPIHNGWDILGNANGGYLLAIVAEAMKSESGRRDPITITAHYLSPGLVGDATTRVSVIKQGRRFSMMEATLQRDGKDVIRVIGTFGDVDTDDLATTLTLTRPEIAPYEECLHRAGGEGVPAIMTKVPIRIHPKDAGFGVGEPSGTAIVRGWVEFADGRPHDTVSLLLAADAFPPPIFNLGLHTGWVPTVELTVHIFGRPAAGPVSCSFVTHVIQSGMLEEDGAVWDSRGVLVATSRQLALLPRGE